MGFHKKYIKDLFPSPFLVYDNLLNEEEFKFINDVSDDIILQNHQEPKNWNCDVLTTFGNKSVDLKNFYEYNNILEKSLFYADVFAEEVSGGCTGPGFDHYKIHDSWLNYYDKDHYQEYHSHPGMICSAIYFLKAPKGSGKLIFRNPYEDMNPFIDNRPNEYNDEKEFIPVENQLIIFKSHMLHQVTRGTNSTPRATIAINFTKS